MKNRMTWLTVILLVITSYSLQSQNWIWSKPLKSSEDVIPKNSGVDAQGNIYTCGSFTGSLDMGTETLMGYGLKDCYITKRNPNGKIIWTRKIGGTASDEEPTKMVLDNKGHLYIVGYFRSSPTTFDATHTLTNTNTQRDAFIARYDTAGNVQYAIRAFWGNAGQTINSITLSPDEDSIFVAGTFTTELKYNMGGEQTLTQKGTRDFFVAKLDTLGNITKLVRYYSNNNNTSFNNLCKNSNKGYYICGNVYDKLFFSPTDSTYAPGLTYPDAFTVKINRNLEFEWVRKGGGTNYDLANNCNCDANGNIYMTGYIYGPATFETGGAPLIVNTSGQDVYLAKYNQAGNLVWIKNGINGGESAQRVFSKNNLVYLTGYFNGTASIWNQDTLISSNSSEDIFIAAYDTSGNLIGAKCTKGKANDKGNCIILQDNYFYNLGEFYSDSLFIGKDTLKNAVSGGTKRNAYIAKSCMIIGINPVVTDVACYGNSTGSIDLTITGDAGPYTYKWSNSATTEDLSGIAKGNYTVTVSFKDGVCYKSATIKVNEPAELTLTITGTNSTCGNSDGAVSVSAAGGNGGNMYLWNDASASTTNTVTGVPAGIYKVTVTDSKGCSKTGQVAVKDSDGPSVSIINIDHVSCNGGSDGSAEASPSGGTPGYTFQWSDGQTNAVAQNFKAGSYIITVTDNGSCKAFGFVTITEPAAITASFLKTNVSCYGLSNGSIDLTPAGGTGQFAYLWSNNATAQDISALKAGKYIVTLTDENSCTKKDSAEITQPLVILTLIDSENVSCNGLDDGTADLTVLGGTAPYTFKWSNNATDEDLTGLAPEKYFVTVTDNNSCTEDDSVIIAEPAVLTSVMEETNTCTGKCEGTAEVKPAGGTAPYFYLWSNSTTDKINNSLCAGAFYVTITDKNGCTAQNSATISSISLPAFNLGKDTTVCADKSITLNAGTGFDSYLWSTGATVNSITIDSNGFGLGVFKFYVTVTDNGCDSVDSVKVTFDICSDVPVSNFSDLNVTIYPNPSRGIFDISITGIKEDAEISILDAQGRMIWIAQHKGSAPFNKHTNISELSKGIYFLKVKSGEAVTVQKIVTY